MAQDWGTSFAQAGWKQQVDTQHWGSNVAQLMLTASLEAGMDSAWQKQTSEVAELPHVLIHRYRGKRHIWVNQSRKHEHKVVHNLLHNQHTTAGKRLTPYLCEED